MRARRFQAGAAIALGTLFVTGPASAADAADDYVAALTRAIAAKERALDANDPPRWEEALRLFQGAAAIRATREATYEVGFAAERLSHTDLAVESYEAALELGLSGPPAARASTFVASHVRALSRLDVRGPAGTRLRVAGLDRGRLPLSRPLVMFPGETAIEIVDLAGLAWTVTARLKAGKNDVIDLAAGATLETPVPAPTRALPPVPPAPTRAAPPVAPAPSVAPTKVAASAPPPAPPVPVVVVAPIPRSPDEPAPRASFRAAWPLIVGGVVVAAAGAVLVAISQGRIESSRTTLLGACMTFSAADVCKTAKGGNGQQTTAQTAEDDIVTWKGVRLGAGIGLGVGAALAVTGVVLKLAGGGAPQLSATLIPDRDGRPSWAVGWRLRF